MFSILQQAERDYYDILNAEDADLLARSDGGWMLHKLAEEVREWQWATEEPLFHAFEKKDGSIARIIFNAICIGHESIEVPSIDPSRLGTTST